MGAILTAANVVMVAALACSLISTSGWSLWVLVIGFGIGVAPVYPNGMALGRKYCVFTNHTIPFRSRGQHGQPRTRCGGGVAGVFRLVLRYLAVYWGRGSLAVHPHRACRRWRLCY